MASKTLYVVHCIDTEGPLNETLDATFERLQFIFALNFEPSADTLYKLQNKLIPLDGREDAVARCIAPELLQYNRDWVMLDLMLDDLLSEQFRNRQPDDFGNGWKFSWHCMDHVGLNANPRYKAYGYGNIYRYYKSKLRQTRSHQDELNWHFHPLSLTKQPLHAATSYANNYSDLLQIICRRVIDDRWFPVVNRPGFHSERPDSHAFLEQWLPFDYANQFFEGDENQLDMSDGRFGDWRRAPASWRGYHPSHDDYQLPGQCRRKIFRCLNVGTRLRLLNENHVHEAFAEADQCGAAILAFADHDYRDIRPDVIAVQEMLSAVKGQYPDVKVKYAGAEEAAIALEEGEAFTAPELDVELVGRKLVVTLTGGQTFGPQPFLAIKNHEKNYYHDNLDVIEPRKSWSYIFDEYTMDLKSVEQIGVATAGAKGGYCVKIIDLAERVK